jgi:Ran GTPase-activating protein (RanGAP) involved in mRNA processing and transport
MTRNGDNLEGLNEHATKSAITSEQGSPGWSNLGLSPPVTAKLTKSTSHDVLTPRALRKRISRDGIYELPSTAINVAREEGVDPDLAHALFLAKCEDAGNKPTAERETRFLQTLSQQAKPGRLLLSKLGLGPTSANSLRACLKGDIAARSGWLDLSSNVLKDSGAMEIAELLKENDTIVWLSLAGNSIGHLGSSALFSALRQNNTLTALDISSPGGVGRNHVGTKGAEAISRLLRSSKCLLSVLNLSAAGLGPEGTELIAAALSCPPNQNQMTGEAMTPLLLPVPSCLTSLILDSNALGMRGAAALASALPLSPLETLSVARNQMGDGGCAALLEMIPSCLALRSLNISQNNLTGDGLLQLHLLLKGNSSLQHLNVSKNELGLSGVRAIAMALATAAGLETVDMMGVNCSDEGAREVSRGMKRSPSLTALNLSNNSIANEGCHFLAQALVGTITLRALDLSHNLIASQGAIDLAEAITTNVNRPLSKLLLTHNKIGEGAARPLLRAVESVPALVVTKITDNPLPYRVQLQIGEMAGRNAAKARASRPQVLQDAVVRARGQLQEYQQVAAEADRAGEEAEWMEEQVAAEKGRLEEARRQSLQEVGDMEGQAEGAVAHRLGLEGTLQERVSLLATERSNLEYRYRVLGDRLRRTMEGKARSETKLRASMRELLREQGEDEGAMSELSAQLKMEEEALAVARTDVAYMKANIEKLRAASLSVQHVTRTAGEAGLRTPKQGTPAYRSSQSNLAEKDTAAGKKKKKGVGKASAKK